MQTKIVYTLISDHTDYYLEQALISVYSLRKYNPEATVELVVDKNTIATLVDKRSKIKEFVSSILEVDIPSDYDKKSCSRFLKTNLRHFINGDYLFIDCDTVICEKLDGIDTYDSDLAAVADINGVLELKDNSVLSRCNKAGFSNLAGQPYYNSGVMLVRDTPQTHKFYEKWYANWQLSASKGVSFDQPALCQTNVDMGFPISELSGIWNCQFKYKQGYTFLSNALIMHYFNPNEETQWTYPSDCIFQMVKEKGYIDSTLKNLLSKPKTLLYSVMTINKESAYRFFNSEMINIYFNNPPLYNFIVRISYVLNKPFNILSKIKLSFN